MKELLLLKHVEKEIILVMYFKNEDEAINWWNNFTCSGDWIIIHEEERKKSGHRYDLIFSKFDQYGKLKSKHIICYSKKESLILKRKLKETNFNYIINIKKIY